MVGLPSGDSKVTEVIQNSAGCRFSRRNPSPFRSTENEPRIPTACSLVLSSHSGMLYRKHPMEDDAGSPVSCGRTAEGVEMLWIFFVAALVLWLVGFGFSVAGGFIHLLLVAAFVLLLISILNGRRSAA